MYNYDYKSIVSKTEAEALRELIFNRAKERAQALAQDTQENYTTSFKNELMDIARDSFRQPGNPFSEPNPIPAVSVEKAKDTTKREDIGFPERKVVENIKADIEYRNSKIQEKVSQNEINDVMNGAGMDFTNRRNFTGALNFLNTKASLSAINKNQHGFEAIA